MVQWEESNKLNLNEAACVVKSWSNFEMNYFSNICYNVLEYVFDDFESDG
jgi:hypothetical protein